MSKNCVVTVLIVAGVLAAGVMPAIAADISALDDKSLTGNDRYDRCLDLSRRNAQRALDAAEAWHAASGGAAALHCQALALTQLHRYPDAAAKLDDAAHDPGVKNVAMAAELLDQAGNAWMLAGRPDKAVSSLTSALSFDPHNTDLLADRARAKAEAKDWSGAESDLTAVLALDSNRADIFVLRASARHAEGRKADARADIERALSVYPGYPEALVERGTMKLEAGDQAGARADWQEVLAEAPDSDAGTAARDRLASLAQPKAGK